MAARWLVYRKLCGLGVADGGIGTRNALPERARVLWVGADEFRFGFLLSVWTNAADVAVRALRIISTGLWEAAALVSLILMFAGQLAPGLKQ